jgi:diguanylate cyclase (GGDEF)-like protein
LGHDSSDHTSPDKGAARARLRSRPPSEPSPGAGETSRPVLLVEDSPVVAKIVGRALQAALGREVRTARSCEEARHLLSEGGESFFAAVVDLSLPDGPDGEAIDLVLDAGVPTVVMTGSADESSRERVLTKNVVDYYCKGDRDLHALADTIGRLEINRRTTVLVVDDSSVSRGLVTRLLETHQFRVLQAADGVEALAVLERNPGVSLLITDFEMPNMDGVELVRRARSTQAPDDLSIIGVSAVGSGALTARFLKCGADDFLNKPFQKEEFYCRIYRTIKNLEQIRAIKKAAYTDQLTGLYNRLFFFQKAPRLFEVAAASGSDLAVAMLDIDFFKKINDTYGHAAGDAALRQAASLLSSHLADSMLLARMGGEEFCIVAAGIDGAAASCAFEAMRAAVEASAIHFEGSEIRFTLSVGVALKKDGSLDAMINRADGLLYRAKESGRNRVVVEGREHGKEAEAAL